MENISKILAKSRFVGEFWNNQKHGHGETITIKYLDEECDLT